MTKYIDVKKLKAEIKRQKHKLELSIQSQGDYGQSCHTVAYDNILSLIDSLQQEQPEPDLTEFENGLVEFYNERNNLLFNKDVYNKHDLEKLLHNSTSKLLAIAREQLQPEIDVEIEKAYKNADEVQYRKGREEALKDLPRWIPNRFDKHNFETCKAYLDTPRYLCYQDKMIDVSELVEKLPGFKEDCNE